MTPSAGASLPSRPRTLKWMPPCMPSSVTVPSPTRGAIRSRAVSLSAACCLSIFSCPPPSLSRSRVACSSSTRGRRMDVWFSVALTARAYDTLAVVSDPVGAIGLDDVLAGPALHVVALTVAGVDRVVAVAGHDVAVQLVAPRGPVAGDRVAAGAADDAVVAHAAAEHVVAAAAEDDVGAVGPVEGVVAAGAGEPGAAALLGRVELVAPAVAGEVPD